MTATRGFGRGALIDRHGAVSSLDGYVVAAAVLRDGTVAAALGNGGIALAAGTVPRRFQVVPAHRQGCLCMTADAGGTAVISGGQDGRLLRIDADGSVADLASYAGKWVELVAVHPASGLRAAAAGRQVHLIARDGTALACREHPSTAAGLAFDPTGRRLAVSHYGGLSVWPTAAGNQRPKRLSWDGSHLLATWAPDGRYLVSAMQENALHGWRMRDGADMLMAGYPVKVKSMSWLPGGRFLATGGADTVVCWPFHGRGGPMGKPPRELGPVWGAIVTTVAAHPALDLVAAGYDDGTALLLPLDQSPPVLLKQPGDGEVTALAWSADAGTLVLGTSQGLVASLALEEWRIGRGPEPQHTGSS